MARQSGLLIYPTLDEVLKQAAVIGLPPSEAKKFFFHWDAVDWVRGKTKIKNWKSALQTWRLNWEEWKGKARSETQAKDCNRELDGLLKRLDPGRNGR